MGLVVWYSLRKIFWSVTGHLSDKLKFSAGQNENLLDKKSLALGYHNILFIKCKLECPKDIN